MILLARRTNERGEILHSGSAMPRRNSCVQCRPCAQWCQARTGRCCNESERAPHQRARPYSRYRSYLVAPVSTSICVRRTPDHTGGIGGSSEKSTWNSGFRSESRCVFVNSSDKVFKGHSVVVQRLNRPLPRALSRVHQSLGLRMYLQNQHCAYK